MPGVTQEDTGAGERFVDTEYEDVNTDFPSESESDLKLQMMLEKPCEEKGRRLNASSYTLCDINMHAPLIVLD